MRNAILLFVSPKKFVLKRVQCATANVEIKATVFFLLPPTLKMFLFRFLAVSIHEMIIKRLVLMTRLDMQN